MVELGSGWMGGWEGGREDCPDLSYRIVPCHTTPHHTPQATILAIHHRPPSSLYTTHDQPRHILPPPSSPQINDVTTCTTQPTQPEFQRPRPPAFPLHLHSPFPISHLAHHISISILPWHTTGQFFCTFTAPFHTYILPPHTTGQQAARKARGGGGGGGGGCSCSINHAQNKRAHYRDIICATCKGLDLIDYAGLLASLLSCFILWSFCVGWRKVWNDAHCPLLT